MMPQKAILQDKPWWWPNQRFEYVVNASVIDVIFMLNTYKKQNTWSILGPRHLWITIEPIKNHQEYFIKFRRRMGKNITVVLKADVKSISPERTLIEGVAQSHKFTLAGLYILFFIHIGIIATQVGTWVHDVNIFLVFEAFFLTIIAILLGQINFGIRRLVSKLEDIIKDTCDLVQAKKDLGLANAKYGNKKRGRNHAF